jgi:hypothetical protein
MHVPYIVRGPSYNSAADITLTNACGAVVALPPGSLLCFSSVPYRLSPAAPTMHQRVPRPLQLAVFLLIRTIVLHPPLSEEIVSVNSAHE